MKAVCAVLAILALALSGCAAQTIEPAEEQPASLQTTVAADSETSDEQNTEAEETMRLLIGETEAPVTWEENASVDALKGLCPLTIQMSMYGGFEQVGPIGHSIVRDDKQTSTSYGDIVLYSGDQIVIFYGSNSWEYTRLGHINLSQREMNDLLSNGDVTITLE